MADIDQLVAINKLEETARNSPGFESESTRFAKFQLDSKDENTPSNLPHDFWAFFDNEMALSNLNPQDVEKLMQVLKVATIYSKMATADYSKTYQDFMFLSQLRAKFFARVMRSTGGIQRERAIQATQIHQVLSNDTPQVRSGILQRVAGAFGGRR